ncbi:hypothetical protein TYRP_009117 [Tyrophagus putrescentiae]|nr:hypothetical protein TYRP_009117 [Tyrophagus putrescentiae]
MKGNGKLKARKNGRGGGSLYTRVGECQAKLPLWAPTGTREQFDGRTSQRSKHYSVGQKKASEGVAGSGGHPTMTPDPEEPS